MLTNKPRTFTSRWSRRDLGHLVGGSLALLASGSAAAAARPKKRKRKPKGPKKPKFRTITRTFSNTSGLTLPSFGPADPFPSTVNVSGLKQGKLLDLNVTLTNLSHGDPSDLNLLLEAPNGRRAMILSDAGAEFNITNRTIILDDQADAGLPFTFPLTSGTFKPTNFGPPSEDDFLPPAPAGEITEVKLSTFQGINPNGTWRLFIVDDAPVGSGGLGSWSLTIRARVRR
jgi:subtilisin-like proprotein convertase family protein